MDISTFKMVVFVCPMGEWGVHSADDSVVLGDFNRNGGRHVDGVQGWYGRGQRIS